MRKIIASILSFLILLNLYIPVNAAQATANASEPSNWHVVRNVSSGNLNQVSCFKNKLYIAIGDIGTIRTSPDSIKWTTNLSVSHDTSADLRDIICTDDQIIVVGARGTILRSTDGVDWTIIKPVTSDSIRNIISVNNLFVAFTDETGEILTSKDGLNWTKIKPITNSSIRRVIYGNNFFLAYTDKPGEILTSKDGINWSIGKTTAKHPINNVIWNGKVFVAIGDNGEISTSKNGVVWQTKVLKNKPDFRDITWNGKMFVAFGTTESSTNEYDYTTTGVYTAISANGYSWSINTIKTKYLKKDSFQVFLCSGGNIIWNGKSFDITMLEIDGYPPDPQANLVSYTSSNGMNWKKSKSPAPSYSNTLKVITGNEFINVCNSYWRGIPSGYYVSYSKDGTTWKMVYSEDREISANDITYSNGKFIIVGHGGEIISSKDGLNWSKAEDEILSSTDGLNWSKADSIIHFPYLWDGKKFISIDEKTGFKYSSVDGLTWKKESAYSLVWDIWENGNKTGRIVIPSHNLFWSGQEYVSFDSNFIFTSKDFIKWDKIEFKYTENTGTICAIATDGSTFALAGRNGTAVSKDMKNWVSRKAANCYKSVIIGKRSFVALNSYGQIDVSSDGLKWKRVHIKDFDGSFNKIIHVGDQFIGVGSNGAILYSKDGSNWTRAESTVNNTLVDVCWTGNEFIAGSADGTIVTSKDVINWHQEELPVKLIIGYSPYHQSGFISANSEIVIINYQYPFLYKSLK